MTIEELHERVQALGPGVAQDQERALVSVLHHLDQAMVQHAAMYAHLLLAQTKAARLLGAPDLSDEVQLAEYLIEDMHTMRERVSRWADVAANVGDGN